MTTTSSINSVAVMDVVVARIWVPDRPGSLGVVAAAIGSVGADVIGIEILERGGGNAIDEITIVLPPPNGGDVNPVDRLIGALTAVDGVAVEDVRPLPEVRVDHPDMAVECAAQIIEAGHTGAFVELCRSLRQLLDGDWATVLSVDGDEPLAADGEIPDLGWLAAFVQGSSHLDGDADMTPGDLAWSRVGDVAIVVIGRDQRPFHNRERQQVSTLARVTAAVRTSPAAASPD
jgi:hypothetical protein